MGNRWKIIIVLGIIIGVIVVAKTVERDISQTPSARDQLGGPPDLARADHNTSALPNQSHTLEVSYPPQDAGEWQNTSYPSEVDLPPYQADPMAMAVGHDTAGHGTAGHDSLAVNSPHSGVGLQGSGLHGAEPAPKPVSFGPETDLNAPTDFSVQPQVVPAIDPVVDPTPTPPANEPVTTPSVPEKRSTPGFPKKHEVLDGESLWEIARQYYGRGDRYDRILAANPSLGDGEFLRAGDTIDIPAPPKSAAKTARKTENDAPSGMVAYTIRAGDTFYGIAREQLGSIKRVDEILEANPGLEPRALHEGKTIYIPKK